ncbi:MAG: CCA tRNA nucleotidyltransferase [Asticcacaulis sp.]
MFQIVFPPEMTGPAVRQVFAALEAAGGEGCVRFVGGCVRDVVMGREPGDLDLSTQLTPDQTEAALTAAGVRHVPTGKAFGTITAIVDGTPFEITSLRRDVETDGRRAVVSFTTDWAEDALRRDFYLNALYADIRGQVFDPTGQGLGDARAGRVRFIGDAETRIREDYLRILRFFRFTASHGSSVDAPSLAACLVLKTGIEGLSGERIQQELFKLLSVSDPSDVVRLMIDEGVLPHGLGGLRISAALFPAVVTLIDDIPQRLMGLIHPEGWAALPTITARLRLSNRLSERLNAAWAAWPEADLAHEASWRRLAYLNGREAVNDALCLRAAEAGVSRARWDAVAASVLSLDVPVFPLKSARLIEAGLKAGPELGQAMRGIENRWVAHDFSPNVIDAAIDEIRERTKIIGQ